jgi:hypothetical protein
MATERKKDSGQNVSSSKHSKKNNTPRGGGPSRKKKADPVHNKNNEEGTAQLSDVVVKLVRVYSHLFISEKLTVES